MSGVPDILDLWEEAMYKPQPIIVRLWLKSPARESGYKKAE
jgi:hypothetical protein